MTLATPRQGLAALGLWLGIFFFGFRFSRTATCNLFCYPLGFTHLAHYFIKCFLPQNGDTHNGSQLKCCKFLLEAFQLLLVGFSRLLHFLFFFSPCGFSCFTAPLEFFA